MDNSKIITRINNLEAAAKLILDECHKIKELSGDIHPPAARKGEWSQEKRMKFIQRRTRVLVKN